MLNINQKVHIDEEHKNISTEEQVLWFRNQLDPTNSIIHRPEHNNTTPAGTEYVQKHQHSSWFPRKQ